MVRSSRLILSPMSVATAIIAVATVTPRVIAAPASNLRRFWRLKDSYTSRTNILLLFEHTAAGRDVRLLNDHGIGCLSGLEGNRIAAARRAHRLRIDWRRAGLANDSVG